MNAGLGYSSPPFPVIAGLAWEDLSPTGGNRMTVVIC
jgi:hypothetical protein